MTEVDQTEENRRLGRAVVKEVIIIAVFYFVYSSTRNLTGSATISEEHALLNAERLIRLERSLHVFHEATLQSWLLSQQWLLWISNVFYGTAHFIVTIGVLIWIFIAVPEQYRFWRNTLAIATALALIGFMSFPLLPPRLLPEHYGFVDTLQKIGGLWNFESGPVNKISNQYAAMPSLHFAWSSWCALALFTLATRWWVKLLGILYPFLTLFVIVVTANHYVLDAVGGAVVLAIALTVSFAVERSRPPKVALESAPENSAKTSPSV